MAFALSWGKSKRLLGVKLRNDLGRFKAGHILQHHESSWYNDRDLRWSQHVQSLEFSSLSQPPFSGLCLHVEKFVRRKITNQTSSTTYHCCKKIRFVWNDPSEHHRLRTFANCKHPTLQPPPVHRSPLSAVVGIAVTRRFPNFRTSSEQFPTSTEMKSFFQFHPNGVLPTQFQVN